MKKPAKLLLGALVCLSLQAFAVEESTQLGENANDRTEDPAVLETCNQTITPDVVIEEMKRKLASENMDELVDWAKDHIKEEFKKTGRSVSTQDMVFERAQDPEIVFRSIKRGKKPTDGSLGFGGKDNTNIKFNRFDFGKFTFNVGSKTFTVNAAVKDGRLEIETAQEREVLFDSLGLPKKDLTRCFATGEFNNGFLDLGSYLEVSLVLENSNKEIGEKEYGFKVKFKKKVNNLED